MTDTEESLLKLMLTLELTSVERAFAQRLAKFFPEGKFLQYEREEWHTRNKGMAIKPSLQYQFEESGKQYFCHLMFYQSGERIATTILRAGEVGGPKFKMTLSGNRFYFTSHIPKDESNWDEAFDEWQTVLTMQHVGLPAAILAREETKEEDERRTERERLRRKNKKELLKQTVFNKYSVHSTPETELIFSVVSRISAEPSVIKAFGDLLPLIRGNDG